ncbi:hypothetical protein [Marinobacterium lutimaris]|uniref:Uncharacterized protein n=1 Tax=Marinobacterium lutimaris TaxID=568106 RepID=A0A1H5W836_9GAMM|nr:hypothetical protein [Marinobacterium lutimaris]SEF95632.1 hypothetical protein SAMN05444390_101967 [Marinobacterium lutimaris]
MNEAVQRYIDTHSKSQGLGFVLTFLFGRLGLFYSSWVAALILCVIAIASVASIIGPIICWVLAIFIGFAAVSKHNEKVKAAAALGFRE